MAKAPVPQGAPTRYTSPVAQILELLARHGAAVVFVFAFLEQIGAPVPAIPVLIVAGAVATTNGASVLPLVLLAVAGALAADTIWFSLGRRYGSRVLGLLCRISLSPDSCVRQTETFFGRWGFPSLLFAKFIPGFSIVAPPLAGALPRATYRRFLVWDLAGSLIWSGVSIATGVLLHGAIERVLETLESLGGSALLLLVSALVLFMALKWWERRRLFRKLRMARISAGELRERMATGSPLVVLDVRHEAAQRADPARIPGALILSAEEIEERLAHVEWDREIVLYCT